MGKGYDRDRNILGKVNGHVGFKGISSSRRD